jgi:hypothetical protein
MIVWVGTVHEEPWLMWWPLTPGRHTLKVTANLDDGSTIASDAIEFTVVSYALPEQEPLSGEVK